MLHWATTAIFDIRSLVYSSDGKASLHLIIFRCCVMIEQNKRSSVSSRIDFTVLGNNPNLKNTFSLDDDPICLLFIVFSVRHIITVVCCVRMPQPESARALLQRGKRQVLTQCWSFLLIFVNDIREIIFVSRKAGITEYALIYWKIYWNYSFLLDRDCLKLRKREKNGSDLERDCLPVDLTL